MRAITALPAHWSGAGRGWQSARYPRTNSLPHDVKALRYPPNGNVDEWVDHGPDGAPKDGEQP